ncbi:MAG TPA: ATP-binding protein [Chloroflexota bacterium]|nr:ATP-binding protein [Chloroflexota bacterium]
MASSWGERVRVTQPFTRALRLSLPDGIKLRRSTELPDILWPAFWLLVGLLASAAYLFGAQLVPAPVSLNLPEPLHPPAAIVLAVLLLTPPRTWWFFLVLAYAFQVAVFLWMGYSPAATLTGHLANVVEALLGAILVRRCIQVPPRFDTLWQFTIYAVCVTVAAVIGATLGAASLLLTGRPYWPTWLAWFLSDVLATLLLAPTILLWVGSRRPGRPFASRWRVAEAAAIFLALLVVGTFGYGSRIESQHLAWSLLYAPMPLLLWAAVRFGPRGVAASLSLITIFAIASVARGQGPLVSTSTDENVLNLQIFLFVIGVPLFFLAALVQERRAAQARLEQSEERYRAVVSNFPHGVVLLFGADLRHIVADGRGLPEMHLNQSSIEGKTPAEAFPAEMADALTPRYQAALAGDHVAFDLLHAGRTYQTHVLPVPSGGVATGMAVLQDATEQRDLEGLTALDHAKTAFFNNVNHEFRTPLTLLLGPLQELLSEPRERLTPEVRQPLEIAHRNGLRLLKLVNTLLELSRLEAGRVEAVYVPTDLGAFTTDLASVFRSAIEQAGLRLVVHCVPLPEPVYVDRDKWEQIVLNLLSNALKFTYTGEIVVTLRALSQRAVLAVHDTGIGIPPDELPHLFERFYRVRRQTGRTQEGTGIGLSLVQELARLHGGTAGVTSIVGEGSTFAVSIPLGTAHLPADQIRTAAGPPDVSAAASYAEEVRRWLPSEATTSAAAVGIEDSSTLTSATAPDDVAGDDARRLPRLLVVDDDADLRAYVERLLSWRGQVKTAGDGIAALEIARAWKPDLILADVMMPRLDGLGLLKAVRADPQLRSISVILLSAWANDEARAEGLRAGADDYLVKPFTLADLFARVDGQVWLARMRNEVSTAAERERLAYDLHDSVTQSLYSLTLLAEAGRRAMTAGQQAQAEEYLGRLGEAAQHTLRDMRLLMSQLRPAPLADLGLVRAIEHRLDAVERRAGITASLVVTGELTLPSAVEEVLYYITQEALNNTLKHAEATEVIVRVTQRRASTTLVVVDNGRGFDVDTALNGGGLGLASIRERAARVGATVEIGPGRRGGTQVAVKIRTEDWQPSALPGSESAPVARAGSTWTNQSVS